MPIEYRLLGPVDAIVDGRAVNLGPPRQRALLAVLLGQANTLVSAGRLVDQIWPHEPPSSAANLVQGYVSGLRKALGKDAIETRGTGYVVRVQPDELDLLRFERLAFDGSTALEEGRPAQAFAHLADALALWRGRALADLADEPFLQPMAARLDELHVLALERRLEAQIAIGRHADAVSEIETLVAAHPLRERLRGLLMLALYRSGRQAEALSAFRQARAVLVDELGIEPGAWLRELEAAMLRQDGALDLEHAAPSIPAAAPLRSILVALLSESALEALVELATPLVREPVRELVVVTTVASVEELQPAGAAIAAHRLRLLSEGIEARTAVFLSLTPGVDLGRLSAEQDVDLLLVDAPAGILEDARVLAILEQAPCDVGVVVGGQLGTGFVLVPFAGAAHDWAAVELGAWLARNRGSSLRLAGVASGASGHGSGRLLANASIAVQRALGVPAEPMLVEPEPEALVGAAGGAGVVVVGLTDRWRQEGLGRARTALATRLAVPTILVRRGVRPGGLAPPGSETRFTWTVAG
jgi:DNA-binding SARP family transcriptional activator